MDNVAILKDVVSYNPLQYDLIKLKPDSKLPDVFYDGIINAFHSLCRPLKDRIQQTKISPLNADVHVELATPITYEILFDGDDKKNTPLFYFGVPTQHSLYIKQRIQSILPNSTLTFIDSQDDIFKDAYVMEYKYAKDSMLSLKVKNNNFLQSMLNLKNILGKGEKILFQVQMTPIGDMWKSFDNEKWDKVRQGKDVTTPTSFFKKVGDVIGGATDSLLSLADEILEYQPQKKDKALASDVATVSVSDFSTASRNKRGDDGFKVRIKAYIVTPYREMAMTHATAIETSMRELEEDNRLVMGKMKKGSVTRGIEFKLGGGNLMGSKELASIVNVPNQRLQREFKIDSINVRQIDAPKQMLKGKVLLGHLTKHGETVGVYLSEDRDLTCLPMFLVTKQGGGKTTFLLNMCNDAVKAGHGLILFDYIKNCATANALAKLHPHCKKIVFDDWEKLCTFAFPEVEILPTDTPYDRRVKANTLAKEVKHLLNAMAVDADPISRIMSEYLTSACKLVFIHNNMTLLKVYEVLTDEETRSEFIALAKSQDVFTEKSFEVKKLRELDEEPTKADRLLDRFSVINEDTLFQEMLLKPYESNVNFAELMNQAEPVVIMMPQDIFTSSIHKDAICTYFISRVRLAMSRRSNFDKMTHVVLDELHQIPNTVKKISETLAEPRKFSIQYVMTMHSLSQIEDKKIRNNILGVGCNFMLLKGTSSQAFEEFKPIIGTDYEYEDLINMDYKFGSLNAFMVDNSYKTFITELPPALRDSNGNLYIN